MVSFTPGSVVALTFAALSLVNASPAVLKRSNHHCTPNFEGAPVSITFGDAELGVDSSHNLIGKDLWFHETEFRLENNGQWENPGFIIKPVGNNNVAVTAGHNSLKIQHVNTNGVDPAQTFTISCHKCVQGASSIRGIVASGCSIKSQSQHDKCIPAREGPIHSLAHCSERAAFHQFNIFTETSNAEVQEDKQSGAGNDHEWEEDKQSSSGNGHEWEESKESGKDNGNDHAWEEDNESDGF